MSKPGRNEPCPCGSGNKYKKCCLERDEQERAVTVAAAKAHDAACGCGHDHAQPLPAKHDDMH